MSSLKQKTSKLFFGKYPYKVSCKIDGAYLIRSFGTDEVLLDDSPSINKSIQLSYSIYRSHNVINLTALKIFTRLAKEYIEDLNVKTRFERKYLDLYTADKKTYEDIQKTLNNYIVKITEPADNNELEKLLENKKYNICDSLPYGKYRYKVIFKENIPITARQNLITWAEKYSDDALHIKYSTLIHFKGLKYKYGSHYFYVKDYTMVTLIHLAAGGYIRKTEEYVLRSLEETA